MTASQLTLGEQFTHELAAAGITMRCTSALGYYVRVAHEHGWTIAQLVTEATRDPGTAKSLPAVITDRFKVIIEDKIKPPVPKVDKSKTGLPKTHKAGVCCDGYGVIYNEDVDPPTQTKCPGVSG